MRVPMQTRISVSPEGIRVQRDGPSPAQQARDALRQELQHEMVRTTEQLRSLAERRGTEGDRAEARERLAQIAAQLRSLETEDHTAQAIDNAFSGGAEAEVGGGRAVTLETPSRANDEIRDIPDNMSDVAMMLFLCTAATIVLYPVMRAIGRLMERRAAPPQRPTAEVEAQLARMEQAIEAVAIEVERVAEGQRYATRLLTDRERVLEPRP